MKKRNKRSFLFTASFLRSFVLFVFLNIFLYCFIFAFNGKLTFSSFDYRVSSHHFLEDPRIRGDSFDLLRSLGQYDAQWYLKIASEGYPKNPGNINQNDKVVMDGLTYAFFPLYPLILYLLNFFIGNIELTAFVFANIMLILNYASLYLFVSKTIKGGEDLAVKTSFLLFFFPFSIFFRSYFPEGIFLLLFIWFCHFLIKKRYVYSSVCLAFLVVTKANAWLMGVVFLIYLLEIFRKRKVSIPYLLSNFLILGTPLTLWITYVFWQTGNPLYFYTVRGAWVPFGFPVTLLYNLFQIIKLPFLHFHSFYSSQVEILGFLAVFFLFVKSKSNLRKEIWAPSLLLWIFPFLFNVFMSFSRYQIVLFPLFIYAAKSLSRIQFYIVVFCFYCLLLVSSIYFVNWYWVG